MKEENKIISPALTCRFCVHVCVEFQTQRGQSQRSERQSPGEGTAAPGTHHLPQIRYSSAEPHIYY